MYRFECKLFPLFWCIVIEHLLKWQTIHRGFERYRQLLNFWRIRYLKEKLPRLSLKVVKHTFRSIAGRNEKSLQRIEVYWLLLLINKVNSREFNLFGILWTKIVPRHKRQDLFKTYPACSTWTIYLILLTPSILYWIQKILMNLITSLIRILKIS